MSIDLKQTEGRLDSQPEGSGGSPAVRVVMPTAATVHGEVKLIVAVHGIGDQLSAATVSSVATRFCRYLDKPAAIPLGRFHGGDEGEVSVAYFPKKVVDGFPEAYGFAEIYWANVPRVLVKEGYTLEEAKRWARTIVGRLQVRKSGMKELTPAQIQDHRLIAQVLQEMIEGVAIMDRLLFVARKAGVFDFNLNKLLNDFLNDVQVVAEFSYQRGQILTLFRDAMRQMAKSFPEAEIHVVAHSEGTVVAFLGILAGIKNANRVTAGLDEHEREGVEADRKWTSKLKGLMTIGSPLNKHVVFWRELFDDYGDAPKVAPAEEDRIRWRNYYDFGDPIGFDLKYTRKWMKERRWGSFFEFNGPEDVAEAAMVRADDLLQATADLTGVVQDPGSRKAAKLIREARSLAEQCKAEARKAEVPEQGSSKSRPVSPGNAQYHARRAVAKVVQAEEKIDSARQAAPQGIAPPRVRSGSAKKVHDHGFTRYYFPGSAHNDYWTDDHVFGHFIQDVVDPDNELNRGNDQEFKQPPASRFVAKLTSYILPYVMSNVLLLIGVYVLFKAVRACISPGLARFDSVPRVAWNVVGLTFLINGMTVLARMPVLSRRLKWRLWAVAIFAGSAVAFRYCVDKDMRGTLGSFLIHREGGWYIMAIVALVFPIILGALALAVRNSAPGTNLWPIFIAGGGAATILLALWVASNPLLLLHAGGRFVHSTPPTLILVILAASISVIAWGLSRQYPVLGMKPLIHTGGAIILLIVCVSIANRSSSSDMDQWLESQVEADRKEAVNQLQAAEAMRIALNKGAGNERDFRRKLTELEQSTRRAADLVRQAEAFRDEGPVWPVVLAFPAFLYLWWLSALLFDLTFFWHRYVRHAVGLSTLNEMIEADPAAPAGA